jgi:GH25 family lysozyme M1 (1,4-beta-N-acetylmuramidase)
MKIVSAHRKLVSTLTTAALALAVGFSSSNAFAQRAEGIDVSHFQGSVNWGSVRGAGLVFAWAKATEGTTITDANFVGNENNGKGAGVFMGAYHFAHPNQHSAGSEAGYFWGVANPYIKADGKTLMPMLDFETFSGYVGATSYTDWANQFNNTIKNNANAAGVVIKPFVYTSASTACNFDTGIAAWSGWLANYNGQSSQSGTPWSCCTTCEKWGANVWNFWQYSSTGSVPGVAGSVDRDVCNGSASTISSAYLATHHGLLNRVGITPTGTGAGYWIVASDGGIFAFGNAGFYGSLGGQTLNSPVVGMARMPNNDGYRLVAGDGGIFCFGSAGFYGSMGGQHLNGPIVSMANSASGNGYWLVGSDGGIYSFGDAPFNGSMGGQHLNAPIVSMARTPSNGYWLVGSDGGIYSFGAPFYGSMGGQALNSPIVGMAAKPQGDGYWLVAADGGIFSFGNVGFYGSMGGQGLSAPIVGMGVTPSGNGYWLVGKDGAIYSFGDASYQGGANF